MLNEPHLIFVPLRRRVDLPPPDLRADTDEEVQIIAEKRSRASEVIK